MAYYVVHDPFRHLGKRELRLFRLEGGRYVESADPFRQMEFGLGLTMWEGDYQDVEARWLRFVDEKGELLPTGQEVRVEAEAGAREAQTAARQAEAATRQAEDAAHQAEARAKAAEQEIARLKALLQAQLE